MSVPRLGLVFFFLFYKGFISLAAVDIFTGTFFFHCRVRLIEQPSCSSGYELAFTSNIYYVTEFWVTFLLSSLALVQIYSF